MRNTKKIILCFLAALVAGVSVGASASALPKLEGSIVARIDDNAGTGSCIESTDKLTVTLRRVILEKKSSWFGLIQDTNFGITFTTTVDGTSGGDTKSASFVKVVQQPVSQFGTGQISLGQEESLLSKYPLTSNGNEFSVVQINVGIVRTKGKSVAANILLSAVGATKSLSLPANPFTSEYTLATSYINSFFAPLLNQAAQDKEAIADNITMNINAGNCSKDDEKTGTKAIVEASSAPNSVDTANPDKYCFAADLQPVFVLKSAPKPAGGNCQAATGFSAVQNSYIAFYVNSVSGQPLHPNTAAVAALPAPKPGEATHFDRQAVRKALASLGIRDDAIAVPFARALVSSAPSADVGAAFALSPTAVEKFREAISRCSANGQAIASCF
jgi:hypothetical protein